MMTGNYMNQLNRSYENQTKLMEQSDGSSLHRPSDNAVNYSKYLRYSNSLAENAQYQSNVNTAVSWMKTSESALSNIGDICKTIKEKATSAANDTNNASAMADIGKEMKSEIQEIISESNAQIGDRYVFSGQADLTQPYSLSTETFNRGLTKTLTDTGSQKSFFNDVDSSGSMSQMLTLNDGTDTYYMNTQTGKLYTKDFVDNGFKNRITAGQTTVADADAAGSLGETKTLDTDQQTYFGTASMVYVGDNNDGYYYDTSSKYYYTKSFVETGYKATGNTAVAPATEAAGTSASAMKVSAFFDNKGVIKTNSTANPTSVTMTLADGTTKTLNFTTVSQQIASYSGDAKYVSMVKQNGAVQPASDTVNVNGSDIYGSDIFDDSSSGNTQSGAAMINNLLTLEAKVSNGENKWVSTDGLTIADTANDEVLKAETKLGSRRSTYDAVSSMLDTQNVAIKADVNNVSGTDLASLAVQLMTAQTIYNMSLSVGSKILPQSLADYLS